MFSRWHVRVGITAEKFVKVAIVRTPRNHRRAPISPAQDSLKGSQVEPAFGLGRVVTFQAMFLQQGLNVGSPENVAAKQDVWGCKIKDQSSKQGERREGKTAVLLAKRVGLQQII